MPRIVPTGIADYAKLIEDNLFFVDKTYFIKDWWEAKDEVTLITRPRRFGKTLTMSMLRYFFSIQYANRSDLFRNMKIWQHEKYHALQGTYPVISLTFSDIKDSTFKKSRQGIIEKIVKQCALYDFIKKEDCLSDTEKILFNNICMEMDDRTAESALQTLSQILFSYYKKKPIILLDEYDSPLIEAWHYHYWDEMLAFIRPLFNATFKANEYLERAILTGVTRVSKESLFSDMNNLKVISTTSEKYADAFGFTQEEMDAVLDEYGKTDREKQEVKDWYDGYSFGSKNNIYNPASIIGYLDEKKLKGYWANTSKNTLIGDMFRQGGSSLKTDIESLINGDTITKTINEELVYSNLAKNTGAVWSLLVAAGYLRIESHNKNLCVLRLTNFEVQDDFMNFVNEWFIDVEDECREFRNALIAGNVENMNRYLSQITENTFGTFDVTGTQPERFYHGFVLGLLAAFWNRYELQSNKESGEGRYDVMLKPLNREQDDPIILEFKVDRRKRPSLKRTVAEAHKQIEEKNYAQYLIGKGYDPNRIRKYGIAFNGKKVLVG